MSVYGRILLAGLGSLALMLGALGFQYLGELAPCKLCIWQRWPHVAAIVLAVMAMTVAWPIRRPLALLGALAMAVGAGIAIYHTGIEQKWWTGPSACTGAVPTGLSAKDLMAKIMSAPVERCDEIPWSLFGLSMAAWNALASLGLALLWVFAALPRTPTRFIQPGSGAI